MAPLIKNMAKKDVQWAKFKSSYMWNKIYYLRRTKFVVYQLASTTPNICMGIGIDVMRHYNGISPPTEFPDARVHNDWLIGSWAFTMVSCISMSLFYGAAVLFDLFWPEREEAPIIQWTWRLSSAAASVLILASSFVVTIVAATKGFRFSGVSEAQENIIRGNWTGPPLEYRDRTLLWVGVAFLWADWVFTLWSTITMWRCYVHNSRYGPFKDHVSKGRFRESGGETLPLDARLFRET